jgi:hypothetical protein
MHRLIIMMEGEEYDKKSRPYNKMLWWHSHEGTEENYEKPVRIVGWD